ncbi:intermembrane transport protein PqiB [Paracoccus marinaquae]|uniref:MCE family protein n=1 Tax=Paracoccus marinaquae TaxID=2841926 RepID=A0ABS6AEN6_9RHOB|nr:MlaD family protein [Paracoccus marinaquae]MBU3029054.1 MCE family protein [Paracoccus marinaquae]
MTETPPPLKPASPARKTAARAALAGISLIWLVPIVALVVTLAIAWNTYSGRGKLIEIEFADATGITPGETKLRFRDITVGQAESARFTSDLSRVVVEVRVDQSVAQYIDDQAAFWIVRPQVSAQGVTRLDTVLTGSFIEGFWDDQIGAPQTEFVGLDRPPLVSEDTKGTRFQLSFEKGGGLQEGAPVLFRGIQVGRMENLRLSESGDSVVADAFVEAPHDQRLTSATVFWDISGFSLSLGARGVSFNVNSLASLLQGGVAFDTLVSGGRPIERGQVFAVQPNEDTARNSLFTSDQAGQLRLTMLVADSVRGLEKGADVQFQGLSVGKVTDLAVWLDEDNESSEILQEVTIALSPTRLGLASDATPEQALAFLVEAVNSGLRARVASAGFLGSSLIVELVSIDDAPEAQIDLAATPYPIIPAIDGDLSDVSQTAESFLDRIGNLPIEEALQSATDMMNSITALTSSQETRAIPESLRGTIDEARTAMADLSQLMQKFREADAAGNAGTALASASELAGKLNEVADRLPGIFEALETTSASVEQVDFAAIGTQAEGILADLRAMLGSEDAEQLPRNLSETLKAASGLLNDLRDGNAAGSLNRALDSASVAADEIARSVQQLPDLLQRLQATATRADAVLAAYGSRSAFNDEAINVLREMRRATASFGSLARMIERNPRAFILGR